MGLLDWFRRKQPGQGTIRNLVYPNRWTPGQHELSNSEVIFAAVSRISTTLGAMPVALYEGYEKVKGAGVADLVSIRPNDNMTPMEFFRTLETDRQTTGNGYALKVPDLSGGVGRLDIIDPGRVTPVIDKDTGDTWYRLDMPYDCMILIHNTQMIHVRHISMDGIRGISPLQVLKGSLDYADSIVELSLQHVEDGIHAGIVLDFPAEMGRDQRKKAIEDFLTVYKESGGQVIALDAGVRATRMDGSLIDPKLMDVDKITRGRVAAVYNMPPHMLGDYSSTGYASLEQEMLEFLALTMEPIVELYRQEFNRKLLTEAEIHKGRSFQWNSENMKMADSNARANYYFKMLRSAGMTPDEVRGKEGFSPMPGGGKLYASRDLVALDDLEKIGTNVRPQQEAPTAPPTPE